MSLLLALLGTLRAALKVRTDLVLENLALRQQLALLRRRSKRPRVGLLDRVFWMWLSRDRFPYRGLDGAAGCRGLPARLGAPVSHPRSRRHLRRTLSTTGEGHRSCRGPHHAALPVAEPFR